MDYNVEHFVLAYPVGLPKTGSLPFLYTFSKWKYLFPFEKDWAYYIIILFFDYIADKQCIVQELDFLAQLWHIVGWKTNK